MTCFIVFFKCLCLVILYLHEKTHQEPKKTFKKLLSLKRHGTISNVRKGRTMLNSEDISKGVKYNF